MVRTLLIMEYMTIHHHAEQPPPTARDHRGHIELERTLDSITVGKRHRSEYGDLRPLMFSIDSIGLLQPITIAPDGLLLCGKRRLEAITRLGWKTARVWVRAGISDDLTRLIAEHDENATHKPLSPIEAASLYRELNQLMKEDAARRQQAARFGTHPETHASEPRVFGCGDGESPAPGARSARETRVRAARFVTGRDSHQQLDRIVAMERIAADTDRPARVRQVANEELTHIRNGGGVDPGWQRVQATIKIDSQWNPQDLDEDPYPDAHAILKASRADNARRVKENRQKRASAAARAKRSMRSFALMWAEMSGWSERYDVNKAAQELSEQDWARFLDVVAETNAFVEAVTRERASAEQPRAAGAQTEPTGSTGPASPAATRRRVSQAASEAPSTPESVPRSSSEVS